MLSEQTIKEGTVLMCSILAFPITLAGNYQVPVRLPFANPYSIKSKWVEMSVDEMEFNLDWNWIHAVIDEIHESYAEVHLGPGSIRISDNGYYETSIGFESPLELTFSALTDYLKWLETDSVPMPAENYEIEYTDDLPF